MRTAVASASLDTGFDQGRQGGDVINGQQPMTSYTRADVRRALLAWLVAEARYCLAAYAAMWCSTPREAMEDLEVRARLEKVAHRELRRLTRR